MRREEQEDWEDVYPDSSDEIKKVTVFIFLRRTWQMTWSSFLFIVRDQSYLEVFD